MLGPGRLGDEWVARPASRISVAEIEPNKPYAEFWMGNHESGPPFVVLHEPEGPNLDLVALKSCIAENPSMLGEKVVERWGNDLPFLFKVLSVAKALSTQAHPDKELATMLHKTRPNPIRIVTISPRWRLLLQNSRPFVGLSALSSCTEN
ncbi:mannose-6-phosphate isomerase 1-like [Phoenix dactylifera]|uniref:Mannose-6-phosphate isomerase 1-like n=1 Tax=Phoenix dactylifera TaxID=42345 RepID=A0A8B7CHD0_PHODC|nr:mannose-6-phosphate isomerase 1-like [Phoenix dactylifera]